MIFLKIQTHLIISRSIASGPKDKRSSGATRLDCEETLPFSWNMIQKATVAPSVHAPRSVAQACEASVSAQRAVGSVPTPTFAVARTALPTCSKIKIDLS